MKKKIFLSLLFVILLTVAIFAYFYFSDRTIIGKAQFNYQAYSIKETDNCVILTQYEVSASPIKIIITYNYENDKIVDAIIETHYQTKLEAKTEYKTLSEKNDTAILKDNIVICNASDVDELADITKEELIAAIEDPYITIESYKKVD